MVDGPDGKSDWPSPTGADYDRAFRLYASAAAPIQDMLRRRYRSRTIRALATSVAWCRTEMDVDLATAGREALTMSVRVVYRRYYPQS